MIQILFRSSGAASPREIPLDELDSALKDRRGMLWIDISNEADGIASTIMREYFNFHPLAVDDALLQAHVPKIDDWGDYVYLVLHGVNSSPSIPPAISTLELDIFLGQRFLVTYHSDEIDAIPRISDLCQRDERFFDNGPAYLLYLLADALVSDYMTVVDNVDEQINLLEDGIFSDSGGVLLEQIFSVKRTLLNLRRILSPQREVLNKLARGDFKVVPESHRIYFRDTYDHLVRLYDIIESIRDLTTGSLDIYVSVYSNRMTQVMKTLTLITTLFIPISFLSGFFGMNFFKPTIPLDPWTGWTAFTLVLLLMILTPSLMYLWMRGKAWM